MGLLTELTALLPVMLYFVVHLQLLQEQNMLLETRFAIAATLTSHFLLEDSHMDITYDHKPGSAGKTSITSDSVHASGRVHYWLLETVALIELNGFAPSFSANGFPILTLILAFIWRDVRPIVVGFLLHLNNFHRNIRHKRYVLLEGFVFADIFQIGDLLIYLAFHLLQPLMGHVLKFAQVALDASSVLHTFLYSFDHQNAMRQVVSTSAEQELLPSLDISSCLLLNLEEELNLTELWVYNCFKSRLTSFVVWYKLLLRMLWSSGSHFR
ncbi:hypothetical protein Tco_0581431 [Tanacetum coccineum]